MNPAIDLKPFFTQNLAPHQKQYEALRALAIEEKTIDEVAEKFGYTPQSLRTLAHRLINGKFQLMPHIPPGPKGRRTDKTTIDIICLLRKEKNWNAQEIANEISKKGQSISIRSVERILKDEGFPKLPRRTFKERGVTLKGEIIPEKSVPLDFETLEPFSAECQVAGIFLLLPYILESGILDVISNSELPESSALSKQQAALSMLALKLIGSERLSHVDQFDTDRGFGLFAGLNILPKPSYICSYSCRMSTELLQNFQTSLVKTLSDKHPSMYQSKTINLDFHSIPHFGYEKDMEKVWCGSRGKTMKGAHTLFAQDAQSNGIVYTKADILRKEGSEEILNFVDYWNELKGVVNEMLVFDSQFTRYDILHELDKVNIKFLTLRRRSPLIIEKALNEPEQNWQKIELDIPKRKYKKVKVLEQEVVLQKGFPSFRQLIVKDNGRAEPTFVITNDRTRSAKEILITYAKRWHIENKLSELIKFFSLNALSSPVMIRIHFDILWTMIADTLYHLFAKDLRRYEEFSAPSIFRHFIDMPGKIVYDGKMFTVKIRKRSKTPVLRDIEKLNKEIMVPWLNGCPLRVEWTA